PADRRCTACGDGEGSREAIERWNHVSEWIDQVAVNLAHGLRAAEAATGIDFAENELC
ncbi:MAG: hypothetical protein JWM63_3301, partial [Gammaproteobacteria bacterium]|nr:hypothetical protein [Gammaproteobacteria bacterium]